MSTTRSAEQVAHRSVGTGPPELVLVHGWAGTGNYFEETIAELDLDHVQATTFDLNGDGGWSLDAIDDQILSVVDAIGAQRSILLGYSMGGKFVQHFALRHPNRIGGLLLVAGTQASSMTLPQELLDDWYGRAGSVDAMKELVRGFLTGPVEEEALDRWAQNAANIPSAALRGSLQTTLESDFAVEVNTLDVPTLVIAGKRDEFFTPELLRATIATQIRGARMAVVDCGHEIPLERPRELAALIEAFLAGLGNSRP